MITTNEVFRKYTDAETFSRIREMDTVSEMWAKSAEAYKNQVAIEDDGLKVTFGEMETAVAHMRAALQKKGLKKGDNVGVFAPNSYELVKAYLAVVTSGMCAVILPAHLDEQAVFGCTFKFSLSAVIYHEALEAKTAFALTHGTKAQFFPTTLTDEDTLPVCTTVTKDDPAVVMFTGGTTGKSKGALLSNGALMAGTVNGCYGYKDVFGQRYLLVLPLSHVFGLVRNLMTCLYTGSDLFICKNNKDMFRDIALFRPTMLVLVPALLEMALTLSKQFKKNMLGDSLKYVIAGAAMVPPYLINEYKAMGVTVLAGYGLTESANLVSGNPDSLEKPESIGFAYGGQELRIVDGELWLRGKNMLTAYIGEEEPAYTEDGWFRTGDLVRIDEDGYMYIVGRIKEVIVLSSGENISPQEVEAHFNELSCVSASQVFEDENGTLALEVVPRMTELQGIEDINAHILAELKKVNDTLPSFQRVQRMAVRTEDFQRTPSMKIVRYKKK